MTRFAVTCFIVVINCLKDGAHSTTTILSFSDLGLTTKIQSICIPAFITLKDTLKKKILSLFTTSYILYSLMKNKILY